MARIVVADDDADIRDLVVFKLRQAGHDVVAVEDGAAAVAACQASAPDLVVLDVMMPGMGGLDATRALRLDPRLARVPVILLTARAQESDIEQGFGGRCRRLRRQAVQPARAGVSGRRRPRAEPSREGLVASRRPGSSSCWSCCGSPRTLRAKRRAHAHAVTA